MDIGNRIAVYSEFIKSEFKGKFYVESFVKYVLPEQHGYFSNYTYAHVFKNYSFFKRFLISFSFFLKALWKYDLLIFISGETILSHKLMCFEFFLYKIFRKKITMIFVGSDIRNNEYLKWKEKTMSFNLLEHEVSTWSSTLQKKLVRLASQFSGSILVSSPDLLQLIPTAKYFPLILDVDRFLEMFQKSSVKNQSDVISIMHIPSNYMLKGSETILKILDEIKNIYGERVELILPSKKQYREDIPYSLNKSELMNCYRRADIVIDQILIGWYGMQSLEAIYLGKKCLCYIDDSLKDFIPKDCPIIKTDAFTLKNDLIRLIEDKNNLVDLAFNQNWVSKYHSMQSQKDKFSKLVLNEQS